MADGPDQRDGDAGRPSRAGIAFAVINYILGALALVVLAGAIWLPKWIGGKPDWAARERNWQVVAGVALILAAVVVFRKRNFSLLVLLLACLFAVASCFDNFHWRGG